MLAHSRCSRKLSFKECWRILGDEMTVPTKEPPRRADLWVPGKAFGHGREILGHRVRKKNARTALCPVGPGGRAAALTAGASACGHRHRRYVINSPGRSQVCRGRAVCPRSREGAREPLLTALAAPPGPGAAERSVSSPQEQRAHVGESPFPGQGQGRQVPVPAMKAGKGGRGCCFPRQPRRPRAHEA